MQHVLRCWQSQSNGLEYKKTLRLAGLRPDPAEGAYVAPANPLVGGEGLAVPSQEPHPRSRPFGPRLFYPHSKINSDAVASDYRPISITPILSCLLERRIVRAFIYPAIQTPPQGLNFADQFGFRPTGSTDAALITMLHAIITMLDTAVCPSVRLRF